MIRLAVLSAVLLSATTASADTYYPEEPPPPSAPLPPPPPLAPPSMTQPVIVQPAPAYTILDPEQGPKSSSTALLLSLTATIAPTIIAASVWGDHEELGDDHDEELLWTMGLSTLIGPSLGHWYAGKVITPGLGVRALGFAVGAAAFGSDDFDEALGLLMLGTSAIIGGAIYDIATAGRSARDYNFAHATRTMVMPTVVPTVGPDGNAQLRLGLTGSF